jgi:hypothetical protein
MKFGKLTIDQALTEVLESDDAERLRLQFGPCRDLIEKYAWPCRDRR